MGIRLPPVLIRKRAGVKASNAAFADDSSVAATLACRYDATASLSKISAQAVCVTTRDCRWMKY
ncbi:hypothetical protein D5Q94_18845 [Salmonella enterica subsp. diarizonae serovar 61:k:1,5,(7)]|uniref:Uncharacterized protein n=1 Tax=Salmonella enterica TaxID=28901 RepID=A0A5U0GP54_SALER|nr:hypothetical protein [Salmonella enterica]ECC9454167.1 hypothetical protein [Salmonella enterica subsp. diarizonae]ECT4111387.1 hypothetical protein [Salmonella enterica subsp. diarizonae serovar 61:k:1,5,(7)]ECU0280762.1 hypothetical protein [Salmonella enterica subsp. diarizonae serovar 61:k:1,5,7]EAP1583456.1 hypothetical protein [Salmonella enterica]